MAQLTPKRDFVVGLLGESPNDTSSVQALLARRYGERVRFVVVSPEITGSQLDTAKLQKIVLINYRFQKPDIVVVIRDLDAPETDRKQKVKRLLFFRKLNKGLERTGIFLLNIQAIEALIAADIEPFNRRYECNCQVPADPMTINDPAAFLKQTTPPNKPTYNEGHCAGLLAEADYAKLLTNCRYFQTFDREFSKRLPA